MPNKYGLTGILLGASESSVWEDAAKEWHIASCYDNQDCSETCLCGHEGIRYEYTIENEINGNLLAPIGSHCILKFGNEELKNEVKVWDEAIKLLEALRSKGPDSLKSLDSRHFSRRLFAFLYEKGAFRDNQYNDFDGANDRDFMINMFNKRSGPTERQKAKIYMILKNEIFPWLFLFEDELARKGA